MASQNTASSLSQTSVILQLVSKARKVGNLNYAGDILPQDAFAFASQNPSVIVDVRTIPEWQFVGVPNLSETPSKLLTLSWKIYPSFSQNPQFADLLAAEPAVANDTPLFFLCRSGGRSLDAAVAMTQAGYGYCFNIAGGFEGEADASGHRGGAEGWKAANLPWVQG